MAATKQGIARIGTSNIVVPGSKKNFPAAFQLRSRLAYYASLFNSLEVNSSFYKVPRAATFEKWLQEVPTGFQFTVKLWKQVTHVKQLAFVPADIDFFMKAISTDSQKTGCILIQFPASITVAFKDKVAIILEHIKKSDPLQQWRKCVEFRHTSWYNDDIYTMLNKHTTSLVLHDMPASKTDSVQTNAGFVYLRFHGVKGDYKGSYDLKTLTTYSIKINYWLQQGRDVYVYFNNTIGDAFNNAQLLQQLINEQQ